MKKIALIAVIALGAFSMTSCKKVYTCTCTVNGVKLSPASTGVKVSKKDAKAWCTAYNSTSGYSCSLD